MLPILDLGDGTMLSQSNAILNYIGTVYNLVPKDAAERAAGESYSLFINEDYIPKIAKALNDKDGNREARVLICAQEVIPKFLAKLDQRLRKGGKFICGNQICVYDMPVGGLCFNLPLN